MEEGNIRPVSLCMIAPHMFRLLASERSVSDIIQETNRIAEQSRFRPPWPQRANRR
jgi:hypothetical protein